MKFRRIFALAGLVAAAIALVVVVDIRPTSRLRLYFFRHYNLESLGRYTSVLDPLAAVIFRPEEDIGRVEILVQPQNVVTMVGSLPPPYPAVFLTREAAPKVPARVVIEGKEYRGLVRIRGKSPRHWSDRKKSLRVDIAGDSWPGGVETTHYVIPYDRGFINDAYSDWIAERLGLPVGRNRPVLLSFNGDDGVYIAVEAQNSAMLERNGLPAGNLYTEVELGHNPAFPFLLGGVDSWRLTETEVGVPPEFSSIERLIYLVNEADDQTFVREIGTVVDIEQFLRWQAHSVLISSDHQDDRHNIKALRNTASGRLMFLPVDPGFYEYGSKEDLERRLMDGTYNTLAKRILSHRPWREYRDRVIGDFLKQYREELIGYTGEARRRILPLLMRDGIKLHSNLRVWWMSRRRVQFMENHWNLLGEL